AVPSQARPPHKRALKNYYGELLSESLNACSTCHLTREQAGDEAFDEEAPPHNAFGRRLRQVGEEWEAQNRPSSLVPRLQAIADEDTDGDGVPNELEILSGHAPGNKDDKPSGPELASAVEARAKLHARLAGYQWTPFQRVVRPAVPQVADIAFVR